MLPNSRTAVKYEKTYIRPLIYMYISEIYQISLSFDIYSFLHRNAISRRTWIFRTDFIIRTLHQISRLIENSLYTQTTTVHDIFALNFNAYILSSFHVAEGIENFFVSPLLLSCSSFFRIEEIPIWIRFFFKR